MKAVLLVAAAATTAGVQATGLVGMTCNYPTTAPPPPVDCELYTAVSDTGPWSACADDGTGKFYRTKVLGIKTPPQNGGKACPAEDDPVRKIRELCSPNDCVALSPSEDTGPFGECEDRDGSGKFFKYKTLGIKTPASNGGSCDPKLREYREPCEAVDCVVLLPSEDTGPFGQCVDKDGSGKFYKYKVLGIKTQPSNGGKACPPVDSPLREVKEFCEPVDCVPLLPSEDNGPFGECVDKDGSNVFYKYKTLGVKTQASNGGKCDPKDREYKELCTAVPCVVYTPEEDPGNFTECIPERDSYSGKYYKYKTLGIKTPPQYGGSCPTEAEREYKVLCPAENCIAFTPEEDTGEYGECQLVDGKWIKSKTLGVRVEAKYGGTCDPKERLYSQPCAAIDCVLYTEAEDTGAYGNCTDRDGSNKYYQYKVLGIKSPAKYGGVDCPAEDNPVREVKKFCEPVDCVPLLPSEDNGPFGNCTDRDGTNVFYKYRTLGIKTEASNGGKCDPKDREDKQLCEAVPCVVNTPEEDTGNFTECMLEVGTYSGKYYKYKTLGIKTPPQYGGSCPTEAEREYKVLCPPENCIAFTPEEDTGEYGDCALVDGKWIKSKTLGVRVEAKYGGTCDPKERLYSQPCAAIDCVLYTEAEDTGAYGNCTDRDGSNKYYQYKVLGIKSPAKYGGVDCPAEDNPVREVKKFCEPVDCVALTKDEDTGPFGNCTEKGNSGKYYKYKILGIKTPAQNGGTCDEAKRTISEFCPPVDCVPLSKEEDKGPFGPCTKAGDYSNKYYKYKILGIKTPAQNGGKCDPKDRTISELCPPENCVPLTPAEDKGPFGPCTKNATNGKYYKTKTLGVKVEAKYGGTCFDKDRQYSELCPPVDCVVNKPEEDKGEFSKCKLIDGEYYKTKVLGIKTPAQYGGSCPSEEKRTIKQLCPNDGWCLPSDPFYDICIPKLAQCGAKKTNIIYDGKTISETTGLALWECCDKCANTAGCVAYTFFPNSNAKKTECYLKWEIDDVDYVYGNVVSSEPKSPKKATCEYHDDRTLLSLISKTLAEYKTDDLDFCCTKCKGTRGCKAFTVSDGICSLESSEGVRVWWPGTRVGYV